jgi:hypothetical protein
MPEPCSPCSDSLPAVISPLHDPSGLVLARALRKAAIGVVASATSAARLGLSAHDCRDEADSSGGNPAGVAAQVPEARSLLIQGPEPKQQGDMQRG